MKIRRNKWNFCPDPTKPKISKREVAYWKSTAAKLAKVGIEVENNLEKSKGECKGNNKACPCSHIEKGCWAECASHSICFNIKNFDRCENKTGTCEPEDCKTCEHYSVACHGKFCTDFVSACIKCDKFIVNCNNCALKYEQGQTPANRRKAIIKDLAPSECYGMMGKYGIHSITTDGSLRGDKGVEVITSGRRVDYWEFYKMMKKIYDSLQTNGAYLNERCSSHMHLLLSYYGKMIQNDDVMGIPQRISEMEYAMPQVILANLHQLVRRYQNAITWMSMALSNKNRMTRWEKFRMSVIPFSAVLNSMPAVRDLIADKCGKKKKYGWLNLQFIKFAKNNDVDVFHVEYRVLDGMYAPSVTAAMACLFYALLIKAIEISRYGVLEAGDPDWMEQTETVKDALLNNTKHYGDGDRFGDTSQLPKYYDILVSESIELIQQLKHILIKVGPAYEVLEKLAQRPVALRLCAGQTWKEIEADFEVQTTRDDELAIYLKQCIDVRVLTDCKNMTEWIKTIGNILKEDPDVEIDNMPEDLEEAIENFVTEKQTIGEILWNEEIGTILPLR